MFAWWHGYLELKELAVTTTTHDSVSKLPLLFFSYTLYIPGLCLDFSYILTFNSLDYIFSASLTIFFYFLFWKTNKVNDWQKHEIATEHKKQNLPKTQLL